MAIRAELRGHLVRVLVDTYAAGNASRRREETGMSSAGSLGDRLGGEERWSPGGPSWALA
jgi:hypothetical protein